MWSSRTTVMSGRSWLTVMALVWLAWAGTAWCGGSVWAANPEICESPVIVTELPTVIATVDGPDEIEPDTDMGTWTVRPMAVPGTEIRCSGQQSIVGTTQWRWDVRASDTLQQAVVATGSGVIARAGPLPEGTYTVSFAAITTFRGLSRWYWCRPFTVRVKKVTVWIESLTVRESGEVPAGGWYGYQTSQVRVRLSRRVDRMVTADLADPEDGTATSWDYSWGPHAHAGPVRITEAWPGLGIAPPPSTAILHRAPGQAVFLPGQVVYDLPLIVTQDRMVEHVEQLRVQITRAVGATHIGSPATILITDDDVGPVVSLPEPLVQVRNGEDPVWQVQVTPAPSEPLTISVRWFQRSVAWSAADLDIGLPETSVVVCPAGATSVVLPSHAVSIGRAVQSNETFAGTLAVVPAPAYSLGQWTTGVSVADAAQPPANTPPTITDVPDQGPTALMSRVGGLAVMVDDVETPASQLVVTATVADPAIVDPASIAVTSGSAGERWVFFRTTAHAGSTVITVTVSDGRATASSSFTVTSVNQAPVIQRVDVGCPTMVGYPTGVQVVATDDVDTTALRVTWTVTPSAAIAADAGAPLHATVTWGTEGVHTLTATVIDGGGLSVTSTVQIVVTPARPLTEWYIVPNQASLALGTSLQYQLAYRTICGNTLIDADPQMAQWSVMPGGTGVFDAEQAGRYGTGTVLPLTSEPTIIKALIGSADVAWGRVTVVDAPVIHDLTITRDDTHATALAVATVSNGKPPYSTTWSITGPASVLAVEGDPLSATVSWRDPGSVTVTVTVTDDVGRTTVRSATSTMAPVPAVVTLDPAMGVVVDAGASTTCTAIILDQFGRPLLPAMPVAWTVEPVDVGMIAGAVSQAGVETGTLQVSSQTRATAATVRASVEAGGVTTSGTALVGIRPLPVPQITAQLNATSTGVTVSADVAGGEGTLHYAWSVTGPAPGTEEQVTAPVDAASVVVPLSSWGTYQVSVVVTDDRNVPVTTQRSLVVPLVLRALTLSPTTVTLEAVQDTVQFQIGSLLDQFDNVVDPSSFTLMWSVTPGAGTISASGLFQVDPETTLTAATVTVAAGGLTSTATVAFALPAVPGDVVVIPVLTDPVLPPYQVRMRATVGGVEDPGYQYAWSVAAGDAPVVWDSVDGLGVTQNVLTATVGGTYTINCRVTNADNRTRRGSYTYTVPLPGILLQQRASGVSP